MKQKLKLKSRPGPQIGNGTSATLEIHKSQQN